MRQEKVSQQIIQMSPGVVQIDRVAVISVCHEVELGQLKEKRLQKRTDQLSLNTWRRRPRTCLTRARDRVAEFW